MCKELLFSETLQPRKVIWYVTYWPGAKSIVIGLYGREDPKQWSGDVSQRSSGPTGYVRFWQLKGQKKAPWTPKGAKWTSPRGIWKQFKLVHRIKHKSRGQVGDTVGKEDCGQIKIILPMRIRSLDFFGQTRSHGHKSDISVQSRCKG